MGIVSLGQSSCLFRSLKMNVIYEKGVYLRRQGCGEYKRYKKVQLVGFENVENIEVLNIVNRLPLLAYFVNNIW